MYRRRQLLGRLRLVEAALSGRQRATPAGIVRGVLFVAVIATFQTGLEAKDSQTTRPAVAKTGKAVNIMWRFDGNGRFPNIHPPCEWRGDRNILWKTPVEIGGYSSPIVVGNKVFVTAEMGSLVCLDVAAGEILWKKDLFSKDSKDIPADLS